MSKIIYTIVLLLAAYCSCFAQLQHTKLTLHFDSELFENVITTIEQKANCRIYYEASWIKTKQVTIHETNKSLKQILLKLCAPQNLYFTIRSPKTIVLTKDYPITTNYNLLYAKYLKNQFISKIDTMPSALPINKKSVSKLDPELQVFTIGRGSSNSKKINQLTGKIIDAKTGEPLVGALIYINKLKKASTTAANGRYSISIPQGQYKVEYRSMGMKTTYRNIIVRSDGTLNVSLHNLPTALNEIIVREEKDDKVRNLNMGVEKISLKTLKQIPMGFGEVDIIKSTLMLPGVQSVGEASGGFNVRGGGIDQNLIVLNDAPIMNTSHFFGFFSGFNSDLVEDITLYKSGVPAKYGGRVSSVLDIKMKDGNLQKLKLQGGISPVSARATVEGPIVKEKLSFILGIRSTYSDWVLDLVDDYNLKNSNANFYDFQGGLTYHVNKKNNLQIIGYTSHDDFDYYGEDAFDYNTTAASLKWKHTFNSKLFSTLTMGLSQYDYLMKSRKDSSMLHEIEYNLNQYPVHLDYTFYPSNAHRVEFGLNGIWYDLSPGTRTPIGDSKITQKTIATEQGVEGALYLSDEFEVTPRLSLSGGVRLNYFANIGPGIQYNYLEGETKNELSIVDSTNINSGIIRSFLKPDFRFSLNLITGLNNSIKFGYNRMHQFIHMISNTASMSPSDIWKLSDDYIPPQQGDQYSLGFYQNIGKFDFSIETYYKDLSNILSYKDGADLIMNDHIETDLISGKGKAYGIECMLEKKKGKFTGWINYTYSRVKHKIEGSYPEEIINDGKYFPANYDKPHDIKLLTNFKPSRRFNITSNLSYSTGRPYTAPLAYFNYHKGDRVYYSDRNSLRMEDYIRLDLAATLNGSLKKKKINHGSWTAAVYNVMGRKNPYSVFFRTEDSKVQGYQMSIFGKPIFTLTYNFKFMGNASDDF